MVSMLILAVLVAGAWAQVPMPCAGPASFTGEFRRFNRERQEFVEGKMYYDSVNKRIREFEYEKLGSSTYTYDKLKLYQLDVEYTVDLKTRKCNVTQPRPRTWFPYGVPPQAQFRTEITIGAVGVTNEELTMAIYEGKTDDGYPYEVTVTQPDCFLVDFAVFSPNNTGAVAGREFFNVVSGIANPEAFIPSKECL